MVRRTPRAAQASAVAAWDAGERAESQQPLEPGHGLVAQAHFGLGRVYHELFSQILLVLPQERITPDLVDKGQLFERAEQSYIDAADCYYEAWKCEGEASASIGFKLAFNYLKAKKYVETVDVCNKVLDMYPDYPKIRKEILEKAYVGFRP